VQQIESNCFLRRAMSLVAGLSARQVYKTLEQCLLSFEPLDCSSTAMGQKA
jgi:hypothetical protein